jgi:hypothetical protein
MRSIDWSKKLSDEDIVWLRNAGHMSEDQIATHQAQFDAKVPEPEIPDDTGTRSALDASSALEPAQQGDGPMLVDPRNGDGSEDETDDYDQWSVSELKAEVDARNGLEGTSEVTIEGTGSNGKATKADLIKGLRLWDAENPQVVEPEES